MITALRPGQVLVAHMPYSEELDALLNEQGIPSLLMVRDPRDIILSHCKHVVRNKEHRLHDVYSSLPDLESRLQVTVRGEPKQEIDPIRTRFEYFLGWLDADSLLVRFEDLIGPRGGGAREAQVDALDDIYAHIGLEMSGENVRETAQELFYTASPTFRKGLIGQWKERMSPDVKKLIRQELGDVIREFGYERNVEV